MSIEFQAIARGIRTSKSVAVVLSRRTAFCGSGRRFCSIVEEFKYLEVLITTEGKMELEMDQRIGALVRCGEEQWAI